MLSIFVFLSAEAEKAGVEGGCDFRHGKTDSSIII